jgi:hypothetical protein
VPPPLDLIFAPDDPPARLEGVSLMPGHLRLPSAATAVAGLTGYGEGGWWVQDIAASMPARLLGARRRAAVLDLCAAPGGKTMQLASAGFEVTAVDSSESRLARLRENLERTGSARDRRRRRDEVEPAAPRSTRSCSTRPARRPASSAATPTCSTASARAPSPSWPRGRRRCSPAPPAG